MKTPFARRAIHGLLAGALSAIAAGLAGAQAVTPAPPAVLVQPGAPAAIVQPLPPSRWTVAQVRQAFELADSDSDGQLTRAEAQRLTIMPRTFEEMDQNKDGVLQRAEYEGALIR